MLVQVLQMRRQSRPRSSVKFSVLGDGLLERTRSTTFALLGATAAVGLAVVAVALQEDWPLVAGSAIPPAPVVHEAVGDATALNAKRSPGGAPGGPTQRGRSVASKGGPGPVSGGAPAISSPGPTPTEVVSSPAAEAAPKGGTGHPGSAHHTAAPQAQAPSAPQPAQTPSVAAPASQPAASPSKSPAPVPPQPAPPEPVASEGPPVEPGVPPWSNGQGHAYGRGEGEAHGHGP